MKTKQLRIMTMTFAEKPTLTSYIVSDYHKGFSTGRHHFTKCKDQLLSNIENHYNIRVDYNKPTKNAQCQQFSNLKGIAECIENMEHYFRVHPQFTALRTYR